MGFSITPRLIAGGSPDFFIIIQQGFGCCAAATAHVMRRSCCASCVCPFPKRLMPNGMATTIGHTRWPLCSKTQNITTVDTAHYWCSGKKYKNIPGLRARPGLEWILNISSIQKHNTCHLYRSDPSWDFLWHKNDTIPRRDTENIASRLLWPSSGTLSSPTILLICWSSFI